MRGPLRDEHPVTRRPPSPEQGNPLYGAATFMLQSVGNIAILAVLFVALVVSMRGRPPQ